MNLFSKETPYEKSKEFLDRQQKLEYLLVLAKFLEAPVADADFTKLVIKKSSSIIEDLK